MEPGFVDEIFVLNSFVKVYVKSSPQKCKVTSDNEVPGSTTDVPARHGLHRDYYVICIRSVNSFINKLEEAQEALGVDPRDYVPVTYCFEFHRQKKKYFPSSFERKSDDISHAKKKVMISLLPKKKVMISLK